MPGTVELTGERRASFQLRQRAAFTTDHLCAALAATLEGVGSAVLLL